MSADRPPLPPPPPSTAPEGAERPRVLLVDDERDNLEALRRLLRRDFVVETAESGETALAFLATGRGVDVIVSDQRMPGLSGSEFLEKAEALDPIATRLLLTGFADLDAVIDAVNRGHIWRYVAKPWEPEELKLTLRQAAERAKLRRSLDDSRRDLERALGELRAKDWARERLLKILLHEFRTAPQVLESLKALDAGGEDAATRLSFLDNLLRRFGHMERDILSLLEDETKGLALARTRLKLSELLERLARERGLAFANEAGADEVALNAPADRLADLLGHFIDLMRRNSGGVAPTLRLEALPQVPPLHYVSIALRGPAGLRPEGLRDAAIEARLAWNLLLEPFVGLEDFQHHSTGLRTDTARRIRQLAALGARAEFEVDREATSVRLLIAFKL